MKPLATLKRPRAYLSIGASPLKVSAPWSQAPSRVVACTLEAPSNCGPLSVKRASEDYKFTASLSLLHSPAQRTAVNLSGVNHAEIRRGFTLVSPQTLEPTSD